MSEWKEYKLGELVDITNGFAFKSENFLAVKTTKSLPVIKIKNVANGDVHLNDCLFHEYDESLNKYLVNKNDILIALTGNHPEVMTQVVGETSRYKVEEKALLNQRVAKIEAKQNLDNNFLYFFLKDEVTHSSLASQSAGSANQANISKGNIEDLLIFCPSLQEQQSIASILSSLDDKIDLLHRQNKTLEQLAETLFRQWFVEEAEESWKIGTLADEFDFSMGQSPPGDSYNEIGDGMIFFQGRTDFDFRFPKTRMFTTQPSRYAKQFDTLISVRAPVGDMNMAYTDCCIGRGLSAFRYKHDSMFYSYTYYKLRSLMQQIKQFEDNGTVFGSITKDDFSKLKNFIPTIELINSFQAMVKTVDAKIFSNYNQIRTLTQLRDTLLPKLMSGEVRVVL